jgi:hypothetical protein
MNKNILSFEEITKQFYDIPLDVREPKYGSNIYHPFKNWKESNKMANKIDKFLTEIVLALLELKRLSLSDEFISIDDVDTYSKQYIKLLNYGDGLAVHGTFVHYRTAEGWKELKKKRII